MVFDVSQGIMLIVTVLELVFIVSIIRAFYLRLKSIDNRLKELIDIKKNKE